MELMIESGRAGVMLDQSEQAMKALNPKPPEDEVDTTQQQLAYSAHSLRSTVLRFGELQMTACRAGTVGGDLCMPYVPGWLKEPLDTVPAPDLLRARQSEAAAHIEPFWQALCSQLITKTDNQDFCAIE
jgi:hypothetical protein